MFRGEGSPSASSLFGQPSPKMCPNVPQEPPRGISGGRPWPAAPPLTSRCRRRCWSHRKGHNWPLYDSLQRLCAGYRNSSVKTGSMIPEQRARTRDQGVQRLATRLNVHLPMEPSLPPDPDLEELEDLEELDTERFLELDEELEPEFAMPGWMRLVKILICRLLNSKMFPSGSHAAIMSGTPDGYNFARYRLRPRSVHGGGQRTFRNVRCGRQLSRTLC